MTNRRRLQRVPPQQQVLPPLRRRRLLLSVRKTWKLELLLFKREMFCECCLQSLGSLSCSLWLSFLSNRRSRQRNYFWKWKSAGKRRRIEEVESVLDGTPLSWRFFCLYSIGRICSWIHKMGGSQWFFLRKPTIVQKFKYNEFTCGDDGKWEYVADGVTKRVQKVTCFRYGKGLESRRNISFEGAPNVPI